MERVHQMNPFAKRESHSKNTVVTYKVLTIITWLLAIIVSFYYTFNSPDDGVWPRRKIWKQNDHYHTAFRMNHIIASIYWIVLFILQGGYIAHLFSGNVERVNAACTVGSHFILNNLFHFAFVMLFVRSLFGWAELIIILNFINLSSLYFRHNAYPRFIHAPVVSGPLAWTFVAIYWNGAIMDYTMGFNLSVLSAAIGVSQFFVQVIALQWIFAFTIMAVLFVATVVVAVPAATGKVQERDAERAPLLPDN
ncbi:hypothetical protein ONZ43_g7773 [Nemania bipapillata]|uniref:Uncharacterized protein n=1 Tax=Nemania bipapillata TaxID=110536 RepID=A0ACC2HPF7_9PEZI|nr:hypothetical protein ONZ43_g7773 [Nemania bipapillata]